MLPCPRALPWSSAAGEGHVPALVTCVPQCCVVVLQHDLGEDTITTLPVFLGGREIGDVQLSAAAPKQEEALNVSIVKGLE